MSCRRRCGNYLFACGEEKLVPTTFMLVMSVDVGTHGHETIQLGEDLLKQVDNLDIWGAH